MTVTRSQAAANRPPLLTVWSASCDDIPLDHYKKEAKKYLEWLWDTKGKDHFEVYGALSNVARELLSWYGKDQVRKSFEPT